MSTVSSVTEPTEVTSPPRRRPVVSAPDLAFAALLLLGAVIVFADTSGMSFIGDDWDFVVGRRGISAHTLLAPHGPHLSLFPILIWKTLLQIFGGGSYVPFRLLASFDIAIVALAIGVACRGRWGRWWGLAPVLLFVTLGPAAIDLLWPFQVGFALSVAFGVLSLIALDRGGRWGDPVACACLLISLGSGSEGIGFVVGAAVMVVLRGDWLRRSWIVLVPALLYLLWYAEYGHQASQTDLSRLSTSLSYAAQSLSATAGPLVGLSSVSPQTSMLDMTFGVPIAVALIAAFVTALWRGWRPRAIFWGAAATLVVIWVAASVTNTGARPPAINRYLMPNAAILLVCLCAAIPRPRPARRGVVIALVGLAVVSATNASQYSQAQSFLVGEARAQRAELGALDLMRRIVAPSYGPGVVDPNLVNITAAPFFSAQDAFGLTEDSVVQMAAQPESTLESVDRILGSNELSLAPLAGAPTSGPATIAVLGGNPARHGGCLIVGAAALNLALTPGSITITTSSRYPSAVTAARFAAAYAYPVGTIPAGSASRLHVAADRAPRPPWRLTLTGTGSRVCPSR